MAGTLVISRETVLDNLQDNRRNASPLLCGLPWRVMLRAFRCLLVAARYHGPRARSGAGQPTHSTHIEAGTPKKIPFWNCEPVNMRTSRGRGAGAGRRR